MADELATTIALKFLDQATAPMQTALSGMTASLQRLESSAKTLGVALIGAFSLKGILDIGDTFEKSMIQMKYTFTEDTQAMTDRAKQISVDVGNYFSFPEIAQAMARTKDVMTELGLTSNEYFQLVTRAADVAAYKNLDLESAMRLVERAALGNKRGMMDLGVVVSDEYMRYTAFGGSLANTWAKFDEGSKAILRYSEIMRQTTKDQGAAKEMAGTLEGSIRSLGNTLKAQFAPELVAPLHEMTSALTSMKPVISDLLSVATGVLSLFNTLPDYVKGPAGVGLLGAMLIGGPAGKLIGMLSLVNELMKSAGADMGSLAKEYQDSVFHIQQAIDAVKGEAGPVQSNIVRKVIPAPEPTVPVTGAPGLEDLMGRLKTKPQDVSTAMQGTVTGMEVKLTEMRKKLDQFGYDLEIDVAKDAGKYLDAELLAIDKGTQTHVDEVWKNIEEQQGKFEKLSTGYGAGKVTSDEFAKGQAALNASWKTGLESIDILKESNLVASSQKIKQFSVDTAQTLAQLKVSYADIRGSVYDQIEAQKQYIEATTRRNILDAKTPEIAQSYRDLADAQEHLLDLRATGTELQGMVYGMDEWRRSIATNFDIGKQSVDAFKQGIDSAASSLAEFVVTGKMNFSDFATSLVKDILKIQIQAMLTKALLGTTEGGGIWGWLKGLLPGLGGAASTVAGVGTSGSIAPTLATAVSAIGFPLQSGGPVQPGKVYIVGEKGSELFIPGSPGNVPSKTNIDAMAKQSSGSMYPEKSYITGESGPEIFTPRASGTIVPRSVMDIAPRQSGAPVSHDQPYIVGEKGPEIFISNVPGNIVPSITEYGANIGGPGRIIPRQSGGSIYPGERYMVGEGGPELFLPRTVGTIVPNIGMDIIPRQSGGSVYRGQTYLVGEKRPEVFVPGSAGAIVPSAGAPSLVVNVRNETGSKVTADQSGPRWDGEKYIGQVTLKLAKNDPMFAGQLASFLNKR